MTRALLQTHVLAIWRSKAPALRRVHPITGGLGGEASLAGGPGEECDHAWGSQPSRTGRRWNALSDAADGAFPGLPNIGRALLKSNSRQPQVMSRKKDEAIAESYSCTVSTPIRSVILVE